MIEGMDKLLDKLATLKKTEAKRAIRTGTREGAKRLQTVARRMAPSRTGALQTAIKVRSLPRSRVYVGSRVTLQINYGSFTELGTHKEKAQHFLQRTVKEAGQDALAVALDIIKDEIEKVVS